MVFTSIPDNFRFFNYLLKMTYGLKQFIITVIIISFSSGLDSAIIILYSVPKFRINLVRKLAVIKSDISYLPYSIYA